MNSKDKIIVDAVNKLKADTCNLWGSYEKDRDTHLMKCDDGDYLAVHRWSNSIVCSMPEFNQCILEMSEAKWMQKPMKRASYVTAKVCTMVFNKPQRFIVGYNIDTFEIMVAVEYETNASVMWSEDIKALLAIECKRLESARD
jgi:hypothetical protein